MNFHIITLFPQIIQTYTNESILKRAQEKKIITINTYNLRDFTSDKHHTVDDKPYGGGAGMILKIEPIYKAIQHIKTQIGNSKKSSKKNNIKSPKPKILIIALCAEGQIWTQKLAQKWLNLKIDKEKSKHLYTYSLKENSKDFKQKMSDEKSYEKEAICSINPKFNHIILICGRYQGFDSRLDNFIDKKISIGKYILTGGEIPALIIIDSLSRLIPNVLGNSLSHIFETDFENNKEKNTQSSIEDENINRTKRKDETANKTITNSPKLYTRPENFEYTDEKGNKKILTVPKIFLTGNHKQIEKSKFEK